MESYISQFLMPVLAAITIVFVFVAYKAIRMAVAQKLHTDETKEHFGYTQQALADLGADLKAVHGKINETVIPQVGHVYKRLLQEGVRVTPESLLQVLDEIGLPKAVAVTEDKRTIAAGVESNGLKISFLLTWDADASDVVIQSFAFWTSHLAESVQRGLLEFGASLKQGSIGVRQLGEKIVLMLDYTIHVPTKHLDRDVLNESIRRLCVYQRDLGKVLEKHSVSLAPMLAGEYLKLESAAQKEAEKLPTAAEEPKTIPLPAQADKPEVKT